MTLKVKVFTSEMRHFEPFVFTIPKGSNKEFMTQEILRRLLKELLHEFPGNDFQITSPRKNEYDILPVHNA